MICLNVSPFKCNSPQTDDKRSSAIRPLLSIFSGATKERGDEERGGCEARRKREGKKGGKKSCINLWRIEDDRGESEKDRARK